MKIEKLTKNLSRRVRQGDWEDILPSRVVLSEEYKVSPASVSIAIQNLAKEGLVRVVPRKGVFVVEGGSGLPTATSDTIGLRGCYLPSPAELLTMDARTLFGRSILSGIWERANHEGCPLLLLPGSAEEQPLTIQSCKESGVKGVIFLGGEGYEEALELRRNGFPVILANRPVGGTPVNFIDYDAAGEVRDVVKRLTTLGHQRIGVLCPKSTSVRGYYDRLKLDFFEALCLQGIEISSSFYWRSIDMHAPDQIPHLMREWMDSPQAPTAIFAWVPPLAQRFMAALRKHNPHQAERISIVASGYLEESEAECSGYVMPHRECGVELLSGLHETIRNPFHIVQRLVACRYVEKGTVTQGP